MLRRKKVEQMKWLTQQRPAADSGGTAAASGARSRVYLVLFVVLIAIAGLLVGRYFAVPAAPAALPSGLGSIPAATAAPAPGPSGLATADSAGPPGLAATPDPQAPPDPASPDPASPDPAAPAADPAAAFTMDPSPPASIKASAVGITSTLGQVAVNPDGTIEVPTDYSQAGWYRLGPTPGELGPAVILGHVDSLKGPAVFYNLSSMRPGQTIDVTRVDNTVAHFRVDAINTYRRDQFPTDAVYGPINYAGLRLITCGGAYDKKAKAYESNVVVFATLIRP